MQKLVWQNANGETINLTSGSYGITEWEGFSNASLNIQSQQVPFQDGAVFLDALIEPRELSVTLKMQDNNNLELRYQLRRELIHKLNPKLGEGYLIYTNDFISKRIKCVAQIPLFETHNSNDSGTPKASLSWVANEPYWEDLEETVVEFNIGENVKIMNNGDIPVQTEIIFATDHVENPSIINTTNKKEIKYEGLLTKNLHINTNFGKKTVSIKDMEIENKLYFYDVNSLFYDDENVLFLCLQDALIMYSYGLNNWKSTFCKENKNKLNGIIYCKEKKIFIVTGYKAIFTSYDLFDWSKHDVANNQVYGVCYSSELELFIAVTQGDLYNDSKILTSPDGINWTSQNYERNKTLYDVCYSDELNLFVIAGGDGVILTSPDGINWTSRTSGVSVILNHINYIPDLHLFVISGLGVILTSPDGVTWTSRTTGVSSSQYISKINYNKDLQLLMGVVNNRIIMSDDHGVNWSNNIASGANYYNDVIYSPTLKKYILIGSYGYIASGSSLTDNIWTKESDNNYDYYHECGINDIIHVDDRFVAISKDGYIIESYNGDDWEIKEDDNFQYIYSITYSKKLNLYVMVGRSGQIKVSDNLINWTSRTSGVSVNLNCILWIDELNLFIIVGGNGIILTSPDSINWTSRTSGVSVNLNCVYYNKDKNLCLIGGAGVILTSSDGINWSNQSSVDMYVRNFAYNKLLDLYIAVGENGYSLKSNDGINWTLIESLASLYLSSFRLAIFNEKLMCFIIVRRDCLLTSYDTERWEIKNTSTRSSDPSNFINKGDNIIIVGDHFLLNETMLKEENKIQNISSDSDMGFNLEMGKNLIRLTRTNGDFSCRIKYRQKYIGV